MEFSMTQHHHLFLACGCIVDYVTTLKNSKARDESYNALILYKCTQIACIREPIKLRSFNQPFCQLLLFLWCPDIDKDPLHRSERSYSTLILVPYPVPRFVFCSDLKMSNLIRASKSR